VQSPSQLINAFYAGQHSVPTGGAAEAFRSNSPFKYTAARHQFADVTRNIDKSRIRQSPRINERRGGLLKFKQGLLIGNVLTVAGSALKTFSNRSLSFQEPITSVVTRHNDTYITQIHR
jgi:hypothetical protein